MSAIGDFINAFKMREPDDEYYDDEEYIDDNLVRVPSYKQSSREYTEEEPPKKKIQKVTPMPIRGKKNSAAGSGDVFGIKPESMEDAKTITDTLLEGRTVILNLENIDVETARRILDFAMGSTYAMNGIMQKISNSIFIIVPDGVEISGAFQDLIGSTGD
ncbi:MAG: cell division protein SepF [Lachnospiraceae bacterium]|nr:cell division protein SepF [Lachnospiraceae bacterium]MDE6742601.1 cell division protein SepF [Lachnospiraceae bacterium]